MSDQPRTERPVVTGIVALVAVGLVVGLILGLVALVGTRFLGLGGDQEASGESTAGAGQSMFLPSPVETEEGGGPRVTLNTEDAAAPQDAAPAPTEASSGPSMGQISLQTDTTAVPSGGRIYFSGVYPGGEGQILFVQRFENGTWADFPASVNVTNGSFRSYLFTGVTGENKFRVVDRQNAVMSNEISVQVG